MPPSISSLTDRTPQMSGEELAASLVPPRQFEQVTLDNYRPDPDFPSQAEALEAARAFVAPRQSAGLFSRKKAPAAKPGLYLDGGFGVGKTHLLAPSCMACQSRSSAASTDEIAAAWSSAVPPSRHWWRGRTG